MNLLSIRVSINYSGKAPVLHDFRLEVREGEIMGLVGHSGCGKSSLALAILGLAPLKGATVSGSILWEGRELLSLREADWRGLRGKELAYVPQSPASSLNPALRIGTQLREAWKLHAAPGGDAKSECRETIFRSLRDTSLPDTDEFLRRYPAEISVGQAQRVLIAMAVLHRPKLLIADEPTSALDTITQSEILGLLGELNHRLGMSVLFISHDLASVYRLCHRIALVDSGAVVECDTPQAIFSTPTHPFTKRLLAALPSLPGPVTAPDDRLEAATSKSLVRAR
jgi:ABC-type dipeptide/oligopeptide/nickel transport system ATPase component